MGLISVKLAEACAKVRSERKNAREAQQGMLKGARVAWCKQNEASPTSLKMIGLLGLALVSALGTGTGLFAGIHLLAQHQMAGGIALLGGTAAAGGGAAYLVHRVTVMETQKKKLEKHLEKKNKEWIEDQVQIAKGTKTKVVRSAEGQSQFGEVGIEMDEFVSVSKDQSHFYKVRSAMDEVASVAKELYKNPKVKDEDVRAYLQEQGFFPQEMPEPEKAATPKAPSKSNTTFLEHFAQTCHERAASLSDRMENIEVFEEETQGLPSLDRLPWEAEARGQIRDMNKLIGELAGSKESSQVRRKIMKTILPGYLYLFGKVTQGNVETRKPAQELLRVAAQWKQIYQSLKGENERFVFESKALQFFRISEEMMDRLEGKK